jgi:hypothetical protein
MTDLFGCLSSRLGPLGPRIEGLVREHARIWAETPSDPLVPDRLYSHRDKKEMEGELSTLVEKVIEGRKAVDAAGSLDPASFEEFAAGLKPILRRILDRIDLPVDAVYDSQFVDSSRLFLKAVREFDPDLRIGPVYQALRNVWIMNTLQYYCGVEVRFTEAIFGYSMIYPYLDNFLDDPAVSPSGKIVLIRRLGGWLEGGGEKPATVLEEKLRVLIAGIERQFPRRDYPGVYQSLLAIYNAQIRSLLQQKAAALAGAGGILDISMEKGGTSVLADAYLAAGDLTPVQQDFSFGFGTILQLADDLQDIGEDAQGGSRTVFSRVGGRQALDPLAFALCRYASSVIAGSLNPARPREQALRELIPRACILMVVESAGKYRTHFSRRCVRDFQGAFPVRFTYVRKLRKTLQSRFLTGSEKISDLDPLSVALMTISSRAFSLE